MVQVLPPQDLGSGGGTSIWRPSLVGGRGGGAIRLNITHSLTNNGVITSSGSNGLYYSGGGSGGSIYVITNTLAGSGTFTAQGGEVQPTWGGSGGAGGRIVIYYQTSSFSGTAEAKGGRGYESGEDGTVCFLDTQNNTLYAGHTFKFQTNDSPFNFNKLILTNSNVNIEDNLSLSSNDLVVDEYSTLTFSGNEILSFNNIYITQHSVITLFHQGKIHLNLNNLIIDSTSSLSANGKGYSADHGPGAGNAGSGAGYGGRGGKSYEGIPGGASYGSSLVPQDLGSGGGSPVVSAYVGGRGGGAIILNLTHSLINNGSITSNGNNGPSRAGGGSGGSIYVITNTLAGSGTFSANGGEALGIWGRDGGGGAGGRIAIYYQTSSFTGTAEAKGGRGYESGEDGTVIMKESLVNSPLTFFNLIEQSANISTSLELLQVQEISLNNVTVTAGDLKGTLNFTNLEIVNITTGPFAGKGFSKGEWTLTLGGLTYNGSWRGLVYFIPSERKIYLKGQISGDISGVAEGLLTESVLGSGTYDTYQAAWKTNLFGTESMSTTLDLGGVISYQSSHAFSSPLYLYQAKLEGTCFGYYNGPLSAVVTHLRLTGENEYKGEGFSIISYNTTLGQGEGWAYNYLKLSNTLELQGLFNSPLLGKLCAVLNENKSPKILSGIIERLDFGLEAMADLEVITWGPRRVSPGQTVDYLIEIRNDGLKNAENTIVIYSLDPSLEYVSSTYSYHNEETNEVRMDLGMLKAKGKKIIRVTGRVPEGLGPHTLLENSVGISTTTKEKDLSGVDTTSWRENIEPANIILEHNDSSIVPGYWDHGGGIVYGTKDEPWTEGRDGYFVIEPLPGVGVKATPLENWDYPFKKEVVILRVEGLTPTQRDYIVNFWIAQIGKQYENWFKILFISPDFNPQSNKWYCSELIGAPYYNLGIDFDMIGIDIYDPAIAPQEIYDSDLTLPVPGGYFNYRDLNINIHTHSSEVITAHDPNIKYGPEGDVSPGQKLNYKVEYANEGEGIAFGVYFTDTLDEDLNDSTLEIGPVFDVKTDIQIAPPGIYNPQTRTITWLVGEVDSGKGGYTELSVNVKNDAPDGTEIINFATVYFPSVPEETRTNGVVSKVTTVIDKTPPTTTATISPSANSADWNKTDVNITLTATDNEGGSGISKTEYSFDGINWITYASSFTITAEGPTTIYYKSTDNAGNVESQKTLGIKIDRTPPEVLISTPQDGAEYILKEQIQAAWSVIDSLSGVALVSATTPQSQLIDTTSVGLKTFKVTSVDKAGNNIDKINTYYVRYNFGGILPPINPDGSSIFKLGRTIPVKFQLKDNYGNFISSAIAKIYISKISNNIAGTEIEAESTSQATTGNLFRYDSAENQYIFNLGTNALSQGTWQIRIELDDGSSKYANMSLK